MENENKCDKYEAFFVFRDEESFLNHLKECPECRERHEKYMKVSKLVKEVGSAYKEYEKRKNASVFKRIACCFLVFFGISAYTGYHMYDKDTASKYEITSDYSYSESAGMPVDEYGFIDL